MAHQWWEWLIPGYSVGVAADEFGKFWKGIYNGLTGQTSAQAQAQANAQNIEFQREVNAQQQYNLEHSHQIEVADLQAAGLNPWLSVGGGAQQANLQTAQVEPVDGSKMLQTTTALMLMFAMKMMFPSKTTLTKEAWRKSVGWK